MTTIEILTGIKNWITNLFARQDGFYETMGVGTAVNLAGQQDRSNHDKFRTSGGTEDIATGTARLEGIKGNAIAWNQLYNDSVPEAITGRTYFIREKVDGVVNKSIQVGAITFTEGSTERNVIDLSLVYNTLTASELPASVAVFEADFKRWFGRALGYEPYDAGSLKPVLMTGYKTVGFNLLDPVTGKAHLVGSYGNTNVAQGLYCYEITGNYTAITDKDGNAITPVNGFFMVENPQEITVTGADENTCIHLTWSGWRNGESEAHWSYLSPIPVTTLTGKLNGEGESVVVFPDGIKSVGNVYDEIKIENGVVKAVKRIGSFDIGQTSWGYRTVGRAFFSNDIKLAFATPFALSIPYTQGIKNVGYATLDSNAQDMTINVVSNHCIYIKDMRFDSVRSYQEGMNGVVIYYVLQTPQEYILDNFELPIRFKVDDFGTEEQIGEGVASILTLKYGVNAVDVLRRLPQNYISVESMDNFLAQLGVAMNGTWSRTWNENTQEYDFTFIGGGSGESGTVIIVHNEAISTLSVLTNRYYRLDVAVETLAITLPDMTNVTFAQSVVIYMTGGTTPNVTFTASGSADVNYQGGFGIEAGKTYEVNALWNGNAWVIASVEIEEV